MFGERHRGTRAYLAVNGGIAVAPVLGSRATDIRSGLGGLDGRRLLKADRLQVGDMRGGGADISGACRRHPGWEEPELRVLRVCDDVAGADDTFRRLCDAQYRLASASDRTGYRLMADRPLPEAVATILSQPVVTGAIQLPPGGSPLLLMADRQTTGGYTIVAVVTAADLPLAGQLGPGDSCQFVACEWEQATIAAADRERSLDQWRRESNDPEWALTRLAGRARACARGRTHGRQSAACTDDDVQGWRSGRPVCRASLL